MASTANATDKLTVIRSGNVITVTSVEGDALRQTKIAASNNPLDGLTLAQTLTYIDANVIDVPSARDALKNLARIVFVMRAEREREKSLTPNPSPTNTR